MRLPVPSRRNPYTVRAGPYSRVLDASAAPSRRNPYTAGRPILPRARRQRGAFQTQPIHCGPAHTPACSTPTRCLPDATYTLRAGPYSRVLDASAVPSRRNPYTAGRPILSRARRQRGAFQTQPIHCGPEARAPRCEREGWFPNLISPTTFLFHGGRRMKHHSGQVSLTPIPFADQPPSPHACRG